MSQLQTVFSNPITVIVSFFAVVYFVKELDNLVQWIKGKLTGYRTNENKKEDLEGEVRNISCISESHTKTLRDITDAIKNINLSVVHINQAIDKKFDELEDKQKEDQVITDRATLYQLYEKMKDYESLSIAEHECFNTIAERYLANGGNGAFRNHIIPSILNKSISED